MFSSITSFISSSISQLPFRLLNEGAEVVHPGAASGATALWKQYEGVRIAAGMGGALVGATGDPCSVFTFDKRTASADQQAMARNAIQRLKTLRHPNILKYIDSVDLPTHLHVLTERVRPMEPLKSSEVLSKKGQLAASLGLQQITSSISWLNNDAKLVHSNLHPGSLYISDSGDWKLAGFDLCHKGTEAVPDSILIGRNSGLLPVQWKAPELVKSASSSAPPTPLHSLDAWSLGCLIYFVFHGPLQSPQQLASASHIPPSLMGEFKKLLATNPANRLNPKYLLEQCAFFQNELVSSVDFLNNLALKSPQEKDVFFTAFARNIGEFPTEFCRSKILPLLTQSLEYGSGLTCFAAILQSVLQIGSQLSESEFALRILPAVLKLFANNERSIRVHLLQHLGSYAGSLSAQLVNDSIFGHVQTGFSDSNALLRELTVKSLLHLAPKLNATNMEVALRHLARLQGDTEPAIRTNTVYCIAKIAPNISPVMQEKVLFGAFSKSLRDPFPPARIAGLMAFIATMELHRPADVARKILPVAAPALADDTREVREAALKLLEACTQRMHTFHAQLRQQQEAALAANPNAIGSHQLAGAAAPGSQTDAAAASAAALASQAGAVLGTLGSWAASTVRSKMSNAEGNPPPRHMQTGAAPSPNSALQSGAATRSNYTGASSTAGTTSVLAAASTGAASSPTSAFAADDFFGDFADGSDDDTPATVVSLSTSKKVPASSSKAGAGAKKEKKSIVSGGTASTSALFSLSPPPAAAGAAAPNSLDSWNFDMDDSSSSKPSTAASQLADDFDDWSAMAAPPAATPSHAKKASTSSGDLLSFAPAHPTSATHKKSAASSSDPFANLSLGSSTTPSPKPTASALGSVRAKPHVAATPLASKPTASASTAKKAAVDDWGDFLNS